MNGYQKHRASIESARTGSGEFGHKSLPARARPATVYERYNLSTDPNHPSARDFAQVESLRQASTALLEVDPDLAELIVRRHPQTGTWEPFEVTDYEGRPLLNGDQAGGVPLGLEGGTVRERVATLDSGRPFGAEAVFRTVPGEPDTLAIFLEGAARPRLSPEVTVDSFAPTERSFHSAAHELVARQVELAQHMETAGNSSGSELLVEQITSAKGNAYLYGKPLGDMDNLVDEHHDRQALKAQKGHVQAAAQRVFERQVLTPNG